jgi:hypothetical protein
MSRIDLNQLKEIWHDVPEIQGVWVSVQQEKAKCVKVAIHDSRFTIHD